MPAPPIETRILLGWFDRETAIRFLTTQCVFDPELTEDAAVALWEPYRDRVAALAPRPRQLPVEYELDRVERDHAADFARGAKRIDKHFGRMVKVDLMDLAVHQFMVLVEHSKEYTAKVCSRNGWLRHSLRLRPAPRQIPIRMPDPNTFIWDVPHNEFSVTPMTRPDGGTHLAPTEWPQWVVATPCDGRWMLWCGYHRSFARMADTNDGEPDGAEARSQPIVLVEKVIGPTAIASLERATGERPALFRDFFDDALFFTVQLRRKRYELRATINGNQVHYGKHEVFV